MRLVPFVGIGAFFALCFPALVAILSCKFGACFGLGLVFLLFPVASSIVDCGRGLLGFGELCFTTLVLRVSVSILP